MLDDAEGLYSLATLFDDEAMPICWSFGLGVDSVQRDEHSPPTNLTPQQSRRRPGL
ncbi:hypothetical protein [Nocardia abscessus]|uniref:hypothetical protein n=1 Tax=Nocardia abscessus TaxID=120957 RepID=UPI002457270B|nr:hypothetical protein [Nocardia abscessus]